MTNRAFARHHRDGQCAFDCAHATIERKLTDTKNVNQALALSKLAVRAEYSQRDGQIKTRSFFANVSRSEIDRGLLIKWKEVTAVLNRRTNTLARLAHGGIRKTDNRHWRRLVVFTADRS